jgi:purine catabolism regulator
MVRMRVLKGKDHEAEFTCADILHLPQLEGVILRAGRQGLHHAVHRVNVMEVPDVIGWVRPGEFLITTGYPFRENPEKLAEMIPHLVQKGVAALGIKTKRFLDAIPAKALVIADEYRFPLFELPIHTVFSDVQREIMERVLAKEARLLSALQHRVQQMSQLLLAGHSLQEILGNMEAVLGNPLILFDANQLVLYSEEADNAANNRDRQAFWSGIRAQCKPGVNEVDFEGQSMKIYLTSVHDHAHRGLPAALMLLETSSELTELDRLTLDRISTLVGMEVMNIRMRQEIEFKYIDQFLQDWLLRRIETETDLLTRAEASGCSLHDRRAYTVLIVRWIQQKPNYKMLQQAVKWFRTDDQNTNDFQLTCVEDELVIIMFHTDSEVSQAIIRQIY